ncbi:alpha-aminoadipic semialdehyde synthase, mitochondrial [Betta splendens]|uniref:Alpha-aminoadipic semialdehyde synthase, mitochondrial n=1 Tax=Betta splendens TaxID=158456 RepID=A0A6P7MR11_BETSP|nr:alpha-aminoadipic semialdehyde synthase, mitochondrial [Betta splendens]
MYNRLGTLHKPAGLFVRGHHKYRGKILGIRREDINPWERRAPLAPHNVEELTKAGVKVVVQPSNHRAIPDMYYEKAGAIIQEDISMANLILGVKQLPLAFIIPHMTYLIFSHTVKAQEVNMALLDELIRQNCRLIDYEKMVDAAGRRVVAFGIWAGISGTLNILHGLGVRLLALGHHTPLLHISMAHNYRTISEAIQSVRNCGYEISQGLMPKSIGPLIICITGSGNVAKGVKQMLSHLPVEYIDVEHLKNVREKGDLNKIYVVIASREHYMRRADTGTYCPIDFEQNPDKYISNFSTEIAPHVSCLMNCIYWGPNTPRLLRRHDAQRLMIPDNPFAVNTRGSPGLPHRMLAICDISADTEGSIEFMTECTTIDKPFSMYDAEKDVHHSSVEGDGILMCSIDNLPAQLPVESTMCFGDQLAPYMLELLESDASRSLEEEKFSNTVRNAVITSNGKLTPNFQYITELRQEREKAQITKRNGMNRVLLLGSGYVSEPVVEYLTRDKKTQVTVASSPLTQAEGLAAKYSNTIPIALDVSKQEEYLDSLVKDHNLVISMLPYSFHPLVARHCINRKVNMVTASYLSPAMKELESSAKEAGITIVNEMGLDPGIDHMLAMECIDRAKAKGCTVESYSSFCGGLPAPESSDNPLRYKFSWSPYGVLLNTTSHATFLKDNQLVNIPAGGALMDSAVPMDIFPGFNLEGFPNRDSTNYTDLYGIETAHTMIRGTLRFKGFSKAMSAFVKLGLINTEPSSLLQSQVSWKQLLSHQIGLSSTLPQEAFEQAVYEHLGKDDTRINTLRWFGMLSDKNVPAAESSLAVLAKHLEANLSFDKSERDMIIMRNDVGLRHPTGKLETKHISMVVYGDPSGFSAMAKTVGYPAAIAARMVLDGEITTKGLVIPITKDIYEPALDRLKKEGLNIMTKSSIQE